jgi:TPR repeat protein
MLLGTFMAIWCLGWIEATLKYILKIGGKTTMDEKTKAKIAELEPKALQGDVEAQYELARIYHDEGAETGIWNFEEMTRWLGMATDKEHPEAMRAMIWLYKDKPEYPHRDTVEALKLLERLVMKHHDSFDMLSLGEMYLDIPEKVQLGDTMIKQGIMRLEKLAMEDDDSKAQFVLGQHYHEIGLKSGIFDYEKMVFWWEKAANNDHEEAMRSLAGVYYSRDNPDRNPQKAIDMKEKLLEAHGQKYGHPNPHGMVELGLVYYEVGREKEGLELVDSGLVIYGEDKLPFFLCLDVGLKFVTHQPWDDSRVKHGVRLLQRVANEGREPIMSLIGEEAFVNLVDGTLAAFEGMVKESGD